MKIEDLPPRTIAFIRNIIERYAMDSDSYVDVSSLGDDAYTLLFRKKKVPLVRVRFGYTPDGHVHHYGIEQFKTKTEFEKQLEVEFPDGDSES